MKLQRYTLKDNKLIPWDTGEFVYADEAEKNRCTVHPCQHRSPPAIGGESYYKKQLAEEKQKNLELKAEAEKWYEKYMDVCDSM